jgi:hypothetical protein
VERRDVLAALPGTVASPAPLLPPAVATSAVTLPEASRTMPGEGLGEDDRGAIERVDAGTPRAAEESGSREVTVADGAAEPLREIPRSMVDAKLRELPPRIRLLYDQLVAAGSLGTHDHMASSGVSHRTGLRDLQTLVELGLAMRVGSRRGARYRPIVGE